MESSMDNPIMFRTRLMSVLLASVIGSSLGLTLPARATDSDAAERSVAPVEAAYEAGSLGYSTQVFHNGDGYYVRAC
jgi:hypothetical protein